MLGPQHCMYGPGGGDKIGKGGRGQVLKLASVITAPVISPSSRAHGSLSAPRGMRAWVSLQPCSPSGAILMGTDILPLTVDYYQLFHISQSMCTHVLTHTQKFQAGHYSTSLVIHPNLYYWWGVGA